MRDSLTDLVAHLVGSKGYVINFGSNGISGSALLYFTLQMSSDLKERGSM